MWNFYYPFEKERQLEHWDADAPGSDGSVVLRCSVESEKDTEKILLWRRKRPGSPNVAEILSVNGMPIRNTPGFYVGPSGERQGLRIHLAAGGNRIEAVAVPGVEGLDNFRMQLIDVPAKAELRNFRHVRKAARTEEAPAGPEISVEGLTPGAGHHPWPGRFGFVKGAGLLDCSMHAFGKISKAYLCGDPRTAVPWAWGYSLIQEEETVYSDKEDYSVSPLTMRWKRGRTEYLCSTAFPGIVTRCADRPFLKVSGLTFAGNYQYVLTAGEVASTNCFSGELPENWLLLFGSTEYPDLPLLIIPDRRPDKVEFLRNGENRLTEVRLYGCSRLTTLTPFGFEPLDPQSPDDETFLYGAADRCRFWARASLAVPVACREYFRNDHAKREVRIVQKFEYEDFTDSWNTPPLHLAPLPPVLGLDREGCVPPGRTDFRFPTKYGPLEGRIGRDSEYTVKMVNTCRKFPLREDNSEAEKILLTDLDNYFEFESRFPEQYRSYAYPGSILESYAFCGTMFHFMPREKRDLLARLLPGRMRMACDPEGKYTLWLTDWGHLYRINPEREEVERYYKGDGIRSWEMFNRYDRKEPFTGEEYSLCYLNCGWLAAGVLKNGSREEVETYPQPYIENDWGIGGFFYMLYLSALVCGDYSAVRENWGMLKKMFRYFELYHDWACMGAGYAEKACTWVEGADFGAFIAYVNLARSVGDREAEEQAVYRTAKLMALDKGRFFSGPYFASLYHTEPWYGNYFLQEEYDLYHNFQSVPKETVLSPNQRVLRGGLHALITEGIYPELLDSFRETSPKMHREHMKRIREAYAGGFDSETPPAGRLQADFSYLLLNDTLDPEIPPEQTRALIAQAKAGKKFLTQWRDVHRYENNMPAGYLESQLNAWLEMRKHPLWLEHWEDLRILSAEWHPASRTAEIELGLTGKAPLLRCGMKKSPVSVLLNGKPVPREKSPDGILLIRPGSSGRLVITFKDER